MPLFLPFVLDLAVTAHYLGDSLEAHILRFKPSGPGAGEAFLEVSLQSDHKGPIDLVLQDRQGEFEVKGEVTGFGDEERLRRAFQRAYGQPPKVFMQQARRRNDFIYLS